MKQYKITYLNTNIVQKRNLIDHSIHLEGKKIGLTPLPDGLNKEERKKFYEKIEEEKKAFLKPYGNYFTEKSPLFEALSTGILKCNGHEYKIAYE